MTAMQGVDERLRATRLALWTDARHRQGDLEALATEAFAGGVGLLVLRASGLATEELREALRLARRAAAPHQGLVGLHGDAGTVGQLGVDVLHLSPPARAGGSAGSAVEARSRLHRWARIGRTVDSLPQLQRARAEDELDYLWVRHTPGAELVAAAARSVPEQPSAPGERSATPWFAVGDIDPRSLEAVLTAGARRVVVGRAVTDADDPRGVARQLRTRLNRAWREDPSTVTGGPGLSGTPRG